MNVRLVGGEMLLWSDGPERPGCGAVRELLCRVLPEDGRTLLLGPHPAELVAWLLARPGEVCVLLRSLPDAELLAARHPGLAVHCGRLDGLAGTEPFDAVLALDGFGRLHSAESEPRTWRESLAEVAGLVAPGGILAMATPNDLGIHRFVEAEPADRARTDADWFPPGFDATHPPGHRALLAELTAAGLAPECCYAGFPTAEAPRVLLAVDELESADPVPDAVAVPSCARGFDGRAVLADPTDLARRAFRHGLAGHLAPLWVTVARRGNPAAWQPPAGIVDDGVCAPLPSAVHELVREGDGGWVRRVVQPAPPPPPGPLRRVPGGAAGPVPRGRVLEEVMLDGCVRDDTAAVGAAVTALAAWLDAHAIGGRLPGRLAFATADNVVWDGERLDLVDGGWALDGPVPSRAVLLRALRRFAARLLGTGHHHPWPWHTDPDRLVEALAALGGHTVQPGEPELALSLDARIREATGGGEPPAGEAPPVYRDLLAVRNGLADRLAEAQARIDRLEAALTSRERSLHATREKLEAAREKLEAAREKRRPARAEPRPPGVEARSARGKPRPAGAEPRSARAEPRSARGESRPAGAEPRSARRPGPGRRPPGAGILRRALRFLRRRGGEPAMGRRDGDAASGRRRGGTVAGRRDGDAASGRRDGQARQSTQSRS
ncbi:putative coiled-coil protein SlyX [Streptosporangium becharense]|uniref:Putative coiled-coil protein SlyX n=1 Tax=Streptosporangium becharense TaxID=1816182 RepID=A0A7W9MGL9_9ACTN|nr:hypothetical protein [Streptosporangium becharense]MBB2909520.1 putative coiled-coil protein SlyX [Streptosporangium becharense]MBB5819523.1 putative coiled-coil protein SlyX [Streptosporangium becharense]